MKHRNILWLVAAAIFLLGYLYASLGAQHIRSYQYRCYPDIIAATRGMNSLYGAEAHVLMYEGQVCVVYGR